MAFQFSLATVLRLKEIAEQREERLLGQIQSQIVQSKQALIDMARQRATVLAQREKALSEGTSAVDLMCSHERFRAIETLEASALDQLAKLEDLREQQLKIYQAANSKREVLSGMCEEHRDEFYKELAKQEQSALDDNFCSRRSLK